MKCDNCSYIICDNRCDAHGGALSLRAAGAASGRKKQAGGRTVEKAEEKIREKTGEKVEEKQAGKRDLTGQQFGQLTALYPVPTPEGLQKRRYWMCRCACGTEKRVMEANLVRGHTQSCGCARLRDLTGQRINSLTVLERSDRYAPRGKRKVQLWKCLCDCGNITYKATDTLTGSRECSCAECAGKRNAAKARENAGFVDGTQLCKLQNGQVSVPHDGKCRGVYYDRRKDLWEAVIKFRGKRIRLGHYRVFEEAVKARQTAEEEIFGTFWRQIQERMAAEAEAEKQSADGGEETAVCAVEKQEER